MHSWKGLNKVAVLALVLVLVGASLLAAGVTRRYSADSAVSQKTRLMSSILRGAYDSAQLSAGVSVGSEFCLACHTERDPEVAEWHDTMHSFFIRKPMGVHTLQPGKGVMANALGGAKDDFMTGLDFNTLTGTAFDALKPNAPILSYNATTDEYFIQLGPNGLKLLVAATLAGQSVGNGQRFMVRIPVSDTATGWSNSIYFGPLAWGGKAWTSNSKDWYTGATPKYATGVKSVDLGPLQTQNYMKTCSGCHITGVRQASIPADPTKGEYIVKPFPAVLIPENSPNYPDLDGDGIGDLANIGCESCHGPGSKHILGFGDPTLIVNPGHITNNQQRSETCLQCHVQIASAPSKVWGFTYNEVENRQFVMTNPPESLDNFQVFTGGKWPDGVNYVGARIDSYKSSGHFQGGHGIACNDCHNPHAETANPAQVRDLITHGSSVVDVPAFVDDNSFCLSCHQGHGPFTNIKGMVKDWEANFPAIRASIEAHTHHPYAADRIMGVSRCTTCHMAPTAGHGGIEGASHTFWVARPEDTIALKDAKGTGNTWSSTGNVNSCSASCHRGKAIVWSDVPANLTPGDNLFNTINELLLASHLVQYFGPEGEWWNTAEAATAAAHDVPIE